MRRSPTRGWLSGTLPKNSQCYAGDEAPAGRSAPYSRAIASSTATTHNPAQAQAYCRRCLVFSETIQLPTGYCVFANAALGNLAARQQHVAAACRYYAVAVDKAGQHAPQYQEAPAYLRHHGGAKNSISSIHHLPLCSSVYSVCQC